LLPPATEKVWSFLKNQPALAGFVLVGGSALPLTTQQLKFFVEPRNKLEIETAAKVVPRRD